MKEGRPLVDLARELDRQNLVKRDFQADTRSVKVLSADTFGEDFPQAIEADANLVMEIPTDDEIHQFPIQPLAVKQMGQKMRIPAAFIDRCKDYPELLSGTFNYLLKAEPEPRLIRTLDGNMRAFLSNSYRTMDNFDLFQHAIFPALQGLEVSVESCEVTERRLYIKACVPSLYAEIPPPEGVVMGKGHTIYVDSVQGGLNIMNSEIGFGRLAIQPGTFTARCSNLAVFKHYEYSKIHLGKKQDQESMIYEILSDDTRRKDDEALWSKVKDLVVASVDGTLFNKIVDDLKASRGVPIENNPVKAVEIFGKQYGLTELETANTLENLVRDGDLTQYGLHNAVTRMSADVESYDRATELEMLGGKVIELKPNEFNVFAKAA